MIVEVKEDAKYRKKVVLTLEQDGKWDAKILLSKKEDPLTHSELRVAQRFLTQVQRTQHKAVILQTREKQSER